MINVNHISVLMQLLSGKPIPGTYLLLLVKRWQGIRSVKSTFLAVFKSLFFVSVD